MVKQHLSQNKIIVGWLPSANCNTIQLWMLQCNDNAIVLGVSRVLSII